MAGTLFEQYGGFSTVRRIVTDFYDRIIESKEISDYFDTVDMRSLVDHQTKFIAQVMGGPISYTDEALQRIHSRLDIQSAHFDEMALLLKETLQDHDIESSDVSVICNEIFSRKHYIVNSAAKQD